MQSSGRLAAAAVLRLEPETDLGRFLACSSDAIASMEQVEEYLAARDFIAADDCLVSSKERLAELLIYRDISDAVDADGASSAFRPFPHVGYNRRA